LVVPKILFLKTEFFSQKLTTVSIQFNVIVFVFKMWLSTTFFETLKNYHQIG
jgi:hypothetical protein